MTKNPIKWPYPPTPQSTLIESRRTEWQLVEIFQHPNFGKQLVVNRELQISETDFAYNTAMTAPLLTLSECRRVAILGGGDGGVMNEVLTSFKLLGKPLEKVILIDIDREVIDLCRHYMPYFCGSAFDDSCSEVIIGDAFHWIAQARDLDAVVYDLTMEPVHQGVSRLEFMPEIIEKIYRSLRPGGMVSLQACGDCQEDRDELLGELRDNLDKYFEARQEQLVMVPSYEERWIFITARKTVE